MSGWRVSARGRAGAGNRRGDKSSFSLTTTCPAVRGMPYVGRKTDSAGPATLGQMPGSREQGRPALVGMRAEEAGRELSVPNCGEKQYYLSLCWCSTRCFPGRRGGYTDDKGGVQKSFPFELDLHVRLGYYVY